MKKDNNNGEEYCYTTIKKNDLEIRHFVFNLDDDVYDQMNYIDENNINGLAFKTSDKTTREQYSLATEIVSNMGHRISSLMLHGFDRIETLDFLKYTPNIKHLGMHCVLKEPFDFTLLSQLESVELWYGKAFAGIFDCASIKRLDIYKMDVNAMDSIQKLSRLKHLQIRQTNVKNIDSLSNLRELEKLHLRHLPKLESINPIKSCCKINSLLFENCKKISDWHMLGFLLKLKELTLENCGNISDINFLKQLEKLERVQLISGTKLLDGNIHWLYEMAGMKRIFYPWRKGTDVTIEQFHKFNR